MAIDTSTTKTITSIHFNTNKKDLSNLLTLPAEKPKLICPVAVGLKEKGSPKQGTNGATRQLGQPNQVPNQSASGATVARKS